ncbi:MAG: PAS domain-containing protein [Bacteroidetes bacterium]|nr:PAS domain-containing protein [Bacteroidota bacterium]
MIKKFKSEFDARYSFEKALMTGYIFSLILLLLIGYITYKQMDEFKQAEASVVHTVNVIRQIKEVQTMRRGYEIDYLDRILTGEKNVTINIDTIDYELNKLSKMIQDNPEQVNNLEDLKLTIHDRKKQLDKFSKLFKGDKLQLQKYIETDLMTSYQKIGFQHRTMIAIEDSLLQKRTEESFSQANQTKTFIIVTSLLGASILFISLIISSKQIKLRNKAEDDLLQINEDLDLLVKKRTYDLEKTNDSLRNEIDIRKQTEQNLIRTQGRVKRLFETDLIGTFISDLQNGVIPEANDTFLKMIGYSKDDLPLKWDVIIPHNDLNSATEHTMTLKSNGFVEPFERVYIRKNGTKINVIVGAALLPDENNQVIAFALDITKDKILQKEFEEINKRLHLALKASKAAEWEWDLVNNKIYWSDDLYEMFGKNKDEFNPAITGWSELVFIEDRDTVNDAYRNSYKNKTNLDVDFRILKDDGTIKWLNLTGRFFINELEIPIIMSGLCIDITVKKKDEGLVHLQNSVSKVLADAQSDSLDEVFDTVLNSMCKVINFEIGNYWALDEHKKLGKRKVINKYADNPDVDFTPYSLIREDKHPESFAWQSFDDKKIRTSFILPIYVNSEFFGVIECLSKYRIEEEESLKELLYSISKQIGSFIEKKIAENNLKEAKDNLEIKVEERTAALNNVLVNLREEVETRIQKEEELKKLYYELREMQKEMVHQEKLTALGRFASGIAHEIRNPLANISSLAQFMAKSKTLDDKAKERLDYILININLANKIIKDLLQFASPDDINFKEGNVNKILNELYQSVKSRCEEKEMTCELMLDDSIPEFELNEEKLYSAFLNFITNSIDAVGTGGTVRISSLKEGENASVIISDTGSGIPPENLDKIFEPFFTTKDEGTGLGMGLAYSIIKSHRGDIKITSEVNKGTIVKIILPLKI